MSRIAIMAGAIAGFAVSTPLAAAPTLELRGVAAHVVIVPEARTDIVVTLLRTSAQLPLKVRTLGKNAYVTGDVGRRVHACRSTANPGAVAIRGRGLIAYGDLPQIVARTPMDVKVAAGDAVFGDIGRSRSLDITNRGCGGWTIADVGGTLRINQAGSGVTRAGGADMADISVAGSGNVMLRTVRDGVTAVSSEDGAVAVASVSGPLRVRVAGSGDVAADAGVVTDMDVSIAGSGGVRFGGVARSLHASIAGSGDVTVAKVTGAISKRVFGSGKVRIGR